MSGNQLGRGAICRQFLVRGGLQPVFDFPSRCLAYREGSIDFHGVDWRPIKGWCHLAEFGEVVPNLPPNFLCAPQPAIRSYFGQFGLEQTVKRRFFGIIFQIVSLLCTFSVPYWAAKHIQLSGRPLMSEVTTKCPRLGKQLSVWQSTEVRKNRDTIIYLFREPLACIRYL